MRKASEQDYFPYGSKLVCYIELTKDKEIRQIQNYVQEKRDIYFRVKNEGSKLYAVLINNCSQFAVTFTVTFVVILIL